MGRREYQNVDGIILILFRIDTKNIKEKGDVMWEHPSNTEVKELKKKYGDIYKQFEKRINEWDPIGLISGGAPKDEYDCITVQLITLLKNGKTEVEIYNFIIRELDDHFEMGIDSISEEYKEKFVNKHTRFSKSITEWYFGLGSASR